MKKKFRLLAFFCIICIGMSMLHPLQAQASFDKKAAKKKISVTYKKTDNGILAIYHNKNKKPVKLTAKLSFKDANGTVLSTEKVPNHCLGASCKAAIFFQAPLDIYGNVIPFVSYKGSYSVAESKFKNYSKKIAVSNDIQATQTTFSAFNLSGKKLSNIQATIVFYDSDNAIIYSCMKYLNCYDKNENMIFNIEYPTGMIRPEKVKVYINYAY